MSKAIEAAIDAVHAEANKGDILSDLANPRYAAARLARTAISAYLAHLAEDEELRDRIKQVVAEGLYYGLPQVDPKLVPDTLAGDIADVIVRTLAGKE